VLPFQGVVEDGLATQGGAALCPGLICCGTFGAKAKYAASIFALKRMHSKYEPLWEQKDASKNMPRVRRNHVDGEARRLSNGIAVKHSRRIHRHPSSNLDALRFVRRRYFVGGIGAGDQ
jgi:hypothetical protein